LHLLVLRSSIHVSSPLILIPTPDSQETIVSVLFPCLSTLEEWRLPVLNSSMTCATKFQY
jgi:hypothetical protein